MKKITILAVLAVLASSVQAQIVSSNSSKIERIEVAPKEKSGYNRIYAGYANLKPHYSTNVNDLSSAVSDRNDDLSPLSGFKVGYLHGSKVANKIPLFLEWGAEFAYNQKSGYVGLSNYDDDYEDYCTSKTFGVVIPLNITYKFEFRNGLYVAPYAGINGRVNVIGKTTLDESDEDYDWFDEDDMGEDEAYKRFQFGGQFGVNLGYKALNVNIGYQMNRPIYKVEESGDYIKLSTRSFTVGLGINF